MLVIIIIIITTTITKFLNIHSLQCFETVGWTTKGHPASNKLDVGKLAVTIWLELCTSYSSSYHHHLQLILNPAHPLLWPDCMRCACNVCLKQWRTRDINNRQDIITEADKHHIDRCFRNRQHHIITQLNRPVCCYVAMYSHVALVTVNKHSAVNLWEVH